MGRSCDFCGEQRSMVYCRSDSACLCLSCDRNVHSANALANRHSRTLLCERCTSQPAIVRCHNENTSLCQNCDWSGHGNASAASTHKRETINCYSGCPSAAELSRIWSFVADIVSAVDLDGKEGTGSVEETSPSSVNLEKETNTSLSEASQILDLEVKPAVLMASSTMGAPKSTTIYKEQLIPLKKKDDIPSLSLEPSYDRSNILSVYRVFVVHLPDSCFSDQQPCCSVIEDIQSSDGDDLYGDFNMADIDFNLEINEELFGYSQNYSEHLLENGGMASLFPRRNIYEVSTSTQGTEATKGPSALRDYSMQPSCSNPMSVDSVVSSKADPIVYAAGKDNSVVTLACSEQTNESSNGEYQDCGVSPLIAMSEPPWCPSGVQNSLTSVSRDNAVRRYKEKKLNRKFDNKIRYASRKERADVRKRVKGRFVKAGERYDYDPMCPAKSF